MCSSLSKPLAAALSSSSTVPSLLRSISSNKSRSLPRSSSVVSHPPFAAFPLASSSLQSSVKPATASASCARSSAATPPAFSSSARLSRSSSSTSRTRSASARIASSKGFHGSRPSPSALSSPSTESTTVASTPDASRRHSRNTLSLNPFSGALREKCSLTLFPFNPHSTCTRRKHPPLASSASASSGPTSADIQSLMKRAGFAGLAKITSPVTS
mmetsp:Transcript_35367/g.80476  ORF Transcript_35367/g.80476 Transcript_35367/m.80476 type:complete len:215 (-) Transcript_35367:169-813(-)